MSFREWTAQEALGCAPILLVDAKTLIIFVVDRIVMRSCLISRLGNQVRRRDKDMPQSEVSFVLSERECLCTGMLLLDFVTRRLVFRSRCKASAVRYLVCITRPRIFRLIACQASAVRCSDHVTRPLCVRMLPPFDRDVEQFVGVFVCQCHGHSRTVT